MSGSFLDPVWCDYPVIYCGSDAQVRFSGFLMFRFAHLSITGCWSIVSAMAFFLNKGLVPPQSCAVRIKSWMLEWRVINPKYDSLSVAWRNHVYCHEIPSIASWKLLDATEAWILRWVIWVIWEADIPLALWNLWNPWINSSLRKGIQRRFF